jgi:hypothetical protein
MLMDSTFRVTRQGLRVLDASSDVAKRNLSSNGNKADVSRGANLVYALLLSAAAIGVGETAAIRLDALQVWESYLLTPLIPILFTMAGAIHDTVKNLENPMRGIRVWDPLQRNSLMFFGALAIVVGFAIFVSGISDFVIRVTLTAAAGTGMVCVGMYLITRFAG